jgi:hypothetical protein
MKDLQASADTVSRSKRQDSPPRPLRGCTKKDTKNTKQQMLFLVSLVRAW